MKLENIIVGEYYQHVGRNFVYKCIKKNYGFIGATWESKGYKVKLLNLKTKISFSLYGDEDDRITFCSKLKGKLYE